MSLLAAAGFDVTVKPTTEPGHATALAAEACRAGGCDVVFGLGGDGTLREIAVGLVGGVVPLAILPGGTTNVLALALDVPANPLRAAELYRASELRALDVGTAAGIPFLMMVTAGVDSEVLRQASQQRRSGSAGWRWRRRRSPRYARTTRRRAHWSTAIAGSPAAS